MDYQATHVTEPPEPAASSTTSIWPEEFSGLDGASKRDQARCKSVKLESCEPDSSPRRYITAANDNFPCAGRVAVLVCAATPNRDEIEVMDTLIPSIDLLVANDI